MMLPQKMITKGGGYTRRFGWQGVLLICTILLAAGCSRPFDLQSPAQSPKLIELHWNWQAHPVLFEPGSAMLSEDESRRLDHFLSGVAPKPVHRILVDFGGEGDWTRLARERIDALTRQLHQYQPDTAVHAYAGGETPPHGVRVLVGHYQIEIPDCPDPWQLSGANPDDARDGTFGCATAVNLSRMVADPSDLQQGRSLSPGDGQVLSAAIRRYWEDNVKDPVAPVSGGGE